MTMQVHRWDALAAADRRRILARAQQNIADDVETVRPVVEDVRRRGDAALVEYTRRFDGADVPMDGIRVTTTEFDAAANSLDEDLRKALDYAITNGGLDIQLAEGTEVFAPGLGTMLG